LGSRSIQRRDLGLIYRRSEDLKNGLAELLEAQKLAPKDADNPIREPAVKGPQGFSFPVVHSFSEEIQNVSISGL
jgi:hypothetical protein